MTSISVVDQPYQPVSNKDTGEVIHRSNFKKISDNPDKLGTGPYAASLAKFAIECQTPMTIGVQGEWGSGKTSLLNMIREDIEETSITYRGKQIRGAEKFKTIWVNTWEHSLLKSPEGCLVSIIEEIIEAISETDGSWQKAQKAKSALAALARGAVKVGAGLAMGSKGAEVANDLLASPGAGNLVKQLRTSLDEIIKTVVKRENNQIERFIIFVDDLDRLEPPVAVQILELLKNIFNVEECVFLLAIDYQVVVKGLKHKFGEPTAENEWEFRAFFDKIIQLPFMMPTAKYDLKNYINSLLIYDIGYISKNDKATIEDGTLATAVQLSLGQNPRSLKRLLNSLSLIRIQNSETFGKDKDVRLRKLVFTLVCLQISFPRVYELLLRSYDFTQWDNEFVNKITGGIQEDNKELDLALNRACRVHVDEFDEEWEQSLFKIVWAKNWQKRRLPEISLLLSLIKDKILFGIDDDQTISDLLKQGLEMTSVTAVASTEEGVFGAGDDSDEPNAKQHRIYFWERFVRELSGSGTVFDTNITKIKSNISSRGVVRKPNGPFSDMIIIGFFAQVSAPVKVESSDGMSKEAYGLFQSLYERRQELETITKAKVKFRIDPEATRQSIVFSEIPDITCRGGLEHPDNASQRDILIKWFAEIYPKLELFINSID